MSRYVMESGKRIPNRRPEWVVVEEGDDNRDTAYRRLVSRALSMRVLYEPHGGRQLRVREVAK